MHFIKSPNTSIGEADLSEHLRKALYAEQKVLWIISGGSNIPTTATVIQEIEGSPTHNLTIIFGDERYGQIDHVDSNAKQLNDLGFDPGQATFIPTLENKTLDETVADFSKKLGIAIGQADHIVGQIGIGPDGHICGMLPNSPALSSQDPSVAYQGGGFTRITITPKILLTIDTAYVFAFGEEKRKQLENLRDEDLPITQQPAQLLKQLSEVYVYNNQVGDAK